MRSVRFLPVVAVLWAAFAVPSAASDNYRVAGVRTDLYFGHLSLVETGAEDALPTIWHEGTAAPEPAVLNQPVGPGDVIRTSGRRCEIQLDTGTIVRLDVDTELAVETVLAASLSSDAGLTNLVLSRGRVLVMYRRYDAHEMFQVLTPNAAVKMRHGTVAEVEWTGDGTTDLRVRAGRASVLFGEEGGRSRDRSVSAPGRLLVLADGRDETAAEAARTPFDAWNRSVNEDFVALHEGKNLLPKPIRTLPRAVFEFAQKFGNVHGEWLWDEVYGYVWRPYVNDRRYPWGDWQPYIYGRWTAVGDRLFWVPEEPWGWVPYHLGLWQWDKKLGWVWLPGSLFAPAWVAWELFADYYAWRPWTLYDWDLQGGVFGFPYGYGFYVEDGDWRYNWPGVGDGRTEPDPVRRISRDMLKKRPAQDLPKELRASAKQVIAALGRGDERLRGSFEDVPKRLVFIRPSDLGADRVHDKVLTLERIGPAGLGPSQAGPTKLPSLASSLAQETVRSYLNEGRRIPAPGGPPEVRFAVPEPGGAADGGERPAPRLRDWNPDVRVARALGVRIAYSSRTNEVTCPELKLSSRDRSAGGFARRLTSDGVVSCPVSDGIDSSSATGAPDSARKGGHVAGEGTKGAKGDTKSKSD
jgi:hypothetical protein